MSEAERYEKSVLPWRKGGKDKEESARGVDGLDCLGIDNRTFFDLSLYGDVGIT